jgi:hypothetical protein
MMRDVKPDTQEEGEEGLGLISRIAPVTPRYFTFFSADGIPFLQHLLIIGDMVS